MGVPTKDALAGKHARKRAGQTKWEAKIPGAGESRANTRGTDGLMFNSAALDKDAQDTVAKADEAAKAQKLASSSDIAAEPYVVTRPKGRTVIVAKKDVTSTKALSEQAPAEKSVDETSPRAGAVAAYNPSHPSVLFHKLKHGLLSRFDVNSLRKKLTGWLRRRPHSASSERRRARHARGDETHLIQHRSGLIIPTPDEPFMLSRTQDSMDDLMAENQRLRRLVEEILQTDPDEIRRMRFRPSDRARH